MPPINPGQQPNNPQILGQSGQPVSSSEASKVKLLAKSFEEAGKYASSAEDKLRRWADAAYKMNATMEEAARLAEERYGAELKAIGIEKLHAQQLSSFATRNNMSWEQIMKMPLPELAKNFDGVAKSMWGLVKLPLTLQAVVTGFRMIDETLTSINRSSGAFAAASGSVAASGGADIRDPNNRTRIAGIMGGMAKMGTEEEIQSAMATMAKSLPGEMAKESGPEWASAAMATAKVWNIEITKVAKLQADLLRSGVSTETIAGFFGANGQLSRLAKDIPADEVVSGAEALAQAARTNAMSYGVVGKALDGFAQDVSRGKASFKEVANALSGAGGKQSNQYFNLAAMGNLSGSSIFKQRIGGDNVADQAEKLIEFERKFPEEFSKMMTQIVQGAGSQFGAVGKVMGRKIAMESGLSGFFATKTSAAEALFDQAPTLPQDMSKGTKVANQFKEISNNAVDFQNATTSFVSEVGRMTKALKYNTMALFESGRAALKAKKDQGLMPEAAPNFMKL